MSIVLSAVLMIKNEELTIINTLNSIISHIDSIIVYDTGSTDSTIDKLMEFTNTHSIPIYLLTGTFEDFSTSRNILLSYINEMNTCINHYLLLIDANEEIRSSEPIKSLIDITYNGFYISHEWKSQNQCLLFKNIKIIKINSGWKYKYPVHECIINNHENVSELPIVFFQNRMNTSSVSRYTIDMNVLEQSLHSYPNDSRLLFYLAQTYKCLGHYENAFITYKKRVDLQQNDEEHHISLYECGMMAKQYCTDWTIECLPWFMSSFECSNRLEPLIEIIEYYIQIKKWHIAFMFLTTAFQLQLPINYELFVHKHDYEWKRWHFGGICSFYINQYKLGKECCEKAIEQGSILSINIQKDIDNLSFYNEFL